MNRSTLRSINTLTNSIKCIFIQLCIFIMNFIYGSYFSRLQNNTQNAQSSENIIWMYYVNVRLIFFSMSLSFFFGYCTTSFNIVISTATAADAGFCYCRQSSVIHKCPFLVLLGSVRSFFKKKLREIKLKMLSLFHINDKLSYAMLTLME